MFSALIYAYLLLSALILVWSHVYDSVGISLIAKLLFAITWPAIALHILFSYISELLEGIINNRH